MADIIGTIIAGIPILASAVVSVIIALKANNKADANTAQIAQHIKDEHTP